MNNEIICNINLFSLNQYVDFPDGRSMQVPFENLPHFLQGVCYEEGIYTIHLFGNEKFIEGIIEDIKSYEIMSYSENKIKFEVN